MNPNTRLTALRHLLKKRGVTGYVVANADTHGSEFVAARYRKREMLTGFTGSAGVALVTAKHAMLWTDGRYTTQAHQELKGSPWVVRIQKLPGPLGIIKEIVEWIETNLRDVTGSDEAKNEKDCTKCTLAIDARVTSLDEAKIFQGSPLIDFTPLEECLIEASEVNGGAEVHPLHCPLREIFSVSPSNTGATMMEKVMRVTDALESAGVGGYLFSNLDDIAWLLNLRGRHDVPNCGVFRAYAMLLPTKTNSSENQAATQWTFHVFSDIPEFLKNHPKCDLWASFQPTLRESADFIKIALSTTISLELHPYGAFLSWIRTSLPILDSSKPLAYGSDVNFALDTCLREVAGAKDQSRIVCLPSCVTYFRNRKNSAEIDGFRKCHVTDAVAIVRYLHWLEVTIAAKEKVTECQGAAQLLKFRQDAADFLQPSFDTISSAGPNSAIIHYSPPCGSSDAQSQCTCNGEMPLGSSVCTCSEIKANEIYLVDSGGHYPTGTTDITRTVLIGDGPASATQRAVFTNVLKGLIGVHVTRFPESHGATASGFLDAIARKALWNVAMDYPHSTGHGVGHGLSVHEGPMGIRKLVTSAQHSSAPSKYSDFVSKYTNRALSPGVVLSNEPGCYIAGHFGVRIENIVGVRKANVEPLISEEGVQAKRGAFQLFELENFTLVPFCRKLLDVPTLTSEEIAWINAYYVEIVEKVGSALRDRGFIEAEKWLQRECSAL